MTDQPRVRVSVWSDYVCPFCYLEQPVLERLAEEYGAALELEWRAFELRPEPVPTLDPQGAYLRTIWARAVYPLADERALALRLPPVQPRSRKALEAAEFARDRGCFARMHAALFQAFFEQGRDIGDSEVLLEVGSTVGLPRDELRAALAAGRYTDRVLQDQRLAQRLGITGVPALLVGLAEQPLDQGQIISGAQPYPAVRAVVEQMLGLGRALRARARG